MERVKEYSELEREPPEFVEPRPPASWPATGQIECKDLVIRYSVSLFGVGSTELTAEALLARVAKRTSRSHVRGQPRGEGEQSGRLRVVRTSELMGRGDRLASSGGPVPERVPLRCLSSDLWRLLRDIFRSMEWIYPRLGFRTSEVD